MSESVRQVFARLMAVCERGFENEHAWKAWWKAHATEIRKLPPSLSNRVALAWDQATAKEFSRAQPPAGASEDLK
jgi:long-subunit fatty acid transport protein